jgi:hypothetical protein
MTEIIVQKGRYAKSLVKNKKLKMVLSPRMGTKGMYVTVEGDALGYPGRKVRIMLESETDVKLVEGVAAPKAEEPVEEVIVPSETDEMIMERMRKKFSVLDGMTLAAIQGDVRAMIVTGPPGVGKSFGIEQTIESLDVMIKMELLDPSTVNMDAPKVMEKVSMASPLGLYQLLWEYRNPGSLLVLDDSDGILYDEACLNMLKAATDSGRRRRLTWRTESKILEERCIDTQFDFEGSIIFVTNLDFENTKGKIGEHLKAIVSRCHYLDIGIHDLHEKFLRCKQIVRDGMLERYKFTDVQIDEILTYIETNKRSLRELSLRMVCKIADLVKMDPHGWRNFADETCLKGR